MKKSLLFAAMMLSSLIAKADYTVPQELRSLIPVGGSEIVMDGHTVKDNADCAVEIKDGPFAFSVILYVNDKAGQLDSRRLGKMQIGLGHHFDSKDVSKNPQRFTSVKEADTIIESDARSSVYVKRSAEKITGIQVVQEEKNLFGRYKVKVNETCILN